MKITRIAMTLKRTRWAKRKSVRAAAQEMGIHASTLCRLEMGRTPRLDLYKKLRAYLNPELAAQVEKLEAQIFAYKD